MTSIVARVKASSSGPGNGAGDGTTSQGGKRPDPNTKTTYTVEQFARMSITDKSNLYTKQPDLYSSLMAEAKEKRLIK